MRFLFSITLFAISFNVIYCMKPSRNLGRIARGHPAAFRQFPYTVRMYADFGENEGLCGAALIGTSWLLTAAHCLNEAIAIEVYLGSVLIDDAEVAYNVPITNIVLHPGFDKINLLNDIALLKIPPTDLCDGIGIVPLPKLGRYYPTYENEAAKGSGWGAINDQRVLADRLLWGRMQILKKEECEYMNIMDHEICTTTNSDWATPCTGDSGGPLVLESTGELVGIISNGDAKSCENGDPTISTRVTSYLDWIKTISGISY